MDIIMEIKFAKPPDAPIIHEIMIESSSHGISKWSTAIKRFERNGSIRFIRTKGEALNRVCGSI